MQESSRAADSSVLTGQVFCRQNWEVDLVKRRAFLLGVVLIVMSVLASGCVGGLIPIIGDPEADEVNAVVNAFMTALKTQNAESMEGLLASTVTSVNEIGWLDISEGPLAKADFVNDWTSLRRSDHPPVMGPPSPDAAYGVTDLQLVQGPSTVVTGSTATSTGTILFTLNHPEHWYYDSLLKLDVEPVYLVEDIYPVELHLEKIGSDWKITSFTIQIGERQSAIGEAWETFATGFGLGDADVVLSACTNPFCWPLEGGLNTLSTHYEWREYLSDGFSRNGPITIDMLYIAPIELNAWSGGFRGVMDDGDGQLIVEIMAVRNGDQWLLSTMNTYLIDQA